jgi:predicted transcriptional regulator
MYDKWYRVLCSLNIEDRTGSIERLGDQVIKAAMLISLSHCNNSLEISVEDLELAITKCEQCMPGVKVVSFGNNSGNVEQDQAIPRILKAILGAENQEIKRTRIMNKTGLDSLVFDRAIETLLQRNAIEQPYRKPGDSNIYYKMSKETYDKYMEFKKEVI